MANNYKANHAIRIIYNGFGWLVDIIDWHDYDYMTCWRNDLMSWRGDLEIRFKWLKNN